MKEFCAGDAGCLPCKQCSEHGDSYNGKCPCGPGKKKKGGKQAAPKKKRTPPAPNSQKDLNMFAMMDKNKDGVITYDDEFVSWMKDEQDMTDMKEIKHFFRQEDQNKDGRLSWDEFTGPKGKTAPKVTAAAATSTPASGGAGGGGGGGGGSSGACSKHKDCTMKEFCAGDAGCLPCKQCGEPGDSYNGKCPCGPGKKKGKSQPKKAPQAEKTGGGDEIDDLMDGINDEL
jgi:hypothetical protein